MAHLNSEYRCSFCDEIPEMAPLFQCSCEHRYCSECYKKLQKSCRGFTDGYASCDHCKCNGRFEKIDVPTELLQKLRVKFGNKTVKSYAKKMPCHERTTTSIEGKFVKNHHGGDDSSLRTVTQTVSAMSISKRPLICLHNGCDKPVTVSSFVSHFKHEHAAVPRLGVERGKELRLIFDPTFIEHGQTFCIAMMTVYETNKIDVVKSQTSQNVIKTCSRLSGKIPLNTFWLMVSCSADQRKSNSYAAFWLYSNSDDRYSCTIELSSLSDKISLATFCIVVGLHQVDSVDEVAASLNCLFVSRGTFLALLSEGDEVNLRITLY